MSPATQVILSGTLTFGVPLILAIRDLVKLHRDRGSWDGGRRDTPPEPPLPGPPGGITVAPKRLPECLIPKPDPAFSRPARPVRVREFA